MHDNYRFISRQISPIALQNQRVSSIKQIWQNVTLRHFTNTKLLHNHSHKIHAPHNSPLSQQLPLLTANFSATTVRLSGSLDCTSFGDHTPCRSAEKVDRRGRVCRIIQINKLVNLMAFKSGSIRRNSSAIIGVWSVKNYRTLRPIQLSDRCLSESLLV